MVVEAKAKRAESSSPTWTWSSLVGQLVSQDPKKLQRPLQPLCQILETIYIPSNVLISRGQASRGKHTIRGHINEVTLKDGNIDFPFSKHSCVLDYDITLPGLGYVEEGSTLFCVTVSAILQTAYSLVMRCMDEETQVYERINLIECGISFPSAGCKRRPRMVLFPESL